MTTTVTGTIKDVTGQPDNSAWVFYSVLREGDASDVVTSKWVRAVPVAGALSVDLESGFCIVNAPNGQVYNITVPDSGTPDIWDLLAAAVAFPPGTSAGMVATAVQTYLTENPTGLTEFYANLAGFPGTGAAGVEYVAIDTGKLYRWNAGTTAYVEMSSGLPTSSDLSSIAAANATGGNVGMNSHKITGLANGTAATDAAALGQVVQTGAYPVVYLDSFAFTGTDDEKLAAAMTYAAAQAHIPAIMFPARDVTLNTGGLAPYSGMKIIGPEGSQGPKDLELGTSGSLATHRVILGGSIGVDTNALFVGTATVYNVFMSGLAFQGATAAQLWHQASGTSIYASQFHALTGYGMAHMFGSPTNHCPITQVTFSGHWECVGGTDTQFSLGGSDSNLWTDSVCSIGTSNAVGAGVYHVILDDLGKSLVGYMYITAVNGWKALKLAGTTSVASGTVFIRPTIEGSNAATPSSVQLVDITGGNWTFFGGTFDFVYSASANPNGAVIQTGGNVTFYSPTYEAATSQSATWPWFYQTGGTATVVDPQSNAGIPLYATWASGKTDALTPGGVWANGASLGATGMLTPCHAATNGGETYTITSGSVTQITGLTVNSGSYTPTVGDRLLIGGAPASSGAGTTDTLTTEPANGIYLVTSLAGGNIALTRSSHMSGSVQPTGLQVWVESFGGWGAGALCVVTTPASTDTTFTWGTTSLAFTMLMGASATGLFNQITLAGAHQATIKTNSSATATQTLTLPATTTDTVVARTSTDALTHKDLTDASNTFPTFNQNTTGNAATATTAGSATTAGACTGNAATATALASAPQGVGALWTPSVLTTANYYYCNSQSSANTPATFTQNDVRLSPWIVVAPITVTAVFAEFTVAGDINSVFHIGIWADNGSGEPGTLKSDCGSISTGTANSGTVSTGGTPGVYAIPGLSVVLAPGLYWVGGCFQTSNGTPVSPTMRTVLTSGGASPVPLPLGSSLPAAGGVSHGWHQTGITGAFGAFTPSLSGNPGARIGFKC